MALRSILNNIVTECSNSTVIITGLFVIVWLVAWVLNALRGTHFDLSALQGMYLTVILPAIGKYAVNSVWNSPRGVSPGAETQNLGVRTSDVKLQDKSIAPQN